MPFLVETVAYDLCTLNEIAHERGASIGDALLAVFLRVDDDGTGEGHEASLRGVRKAQVKLATYYLHKGDEARARRVYDDMAGEDRAAARVDSRAEMLGVESSEYWEVTDRGVNFDYLPPERKARLEQFFAWFGRSSRAQLQPSRYRARRAPRSATRRRAAVSATTPDRSGSRPAAANSRSCTARARRAGVCRKRVASASPPICGMIRSVSSRSIGPRGAR